ncbi:MAG: PAS domain-containing protein [Thermodesulfobacteriota bacterium]
MRRVCAWCGGELEPGGNPADPVVTHGICPSCSDHFFGDPDLPPLRRFLDRLEAPVLLVDGEGAVLTANRAARELLGKSLPEIEGHRSGDVMECARARLPGGCGRTEHCRACAIRIAVSETFATGVSREGLCAVEGAGTFGASGSSVVRISTERVGGTVLLRIDEMGPAGGPPPAGR